MWWNRSEATKNFSARANKWTLMVAWSVEGLVKQSDSSRLHHELFQLFNAGFLRLSPFKLSISQKKTTCQIPIPSIPKAQKSPEPCGACHNFHRSWSLGRTLLVDTSSGTREKDSKTLHFHPSQQSKCKKHQETFFNKTGQVDTELKNYQLSHTNFIPSGQGHFGSGSSKASPMANRSASSQGQISNHVWWKIRDPSLDPLSSEKFPNCKRGNCMKLCGFGGIQPQLDPTCPWLAVKIIGSNKAPRRPHLLFCLSSRNFSSCLPSVVNVFWNVSFNLNN